MRNHKSFEILKGSTITEIHGMEVDSDEITFTTIKDGTTSTYKMYHEQDCCESVDLNDICGDLDDLLNSEVIHAEERSSEGESEWGTSTWTFYDIQTTKGSVHLKWFGESNGYYSESVDFIQIS